MENNNLDSAEKMRLTTEFFFEKDHKQAVNESFARCTGPEIFRAALFVRDGINKVSEINPIDSVKLVLQKAQEKFMQNTEGNRAAKEIVERLSGIFLNYTEDSTEVVTAPMNIAGATGKTVGEVLSEQRDQKNVKTEDVETPESNQEKPSKEQKLIAQAEEIIKIIKIAKSPNVKLKAIKKLRALANETLENHLQIDPSSFSSAKLCIEILARIETASAFYIEEKGAWWDKAKGGKVNIPKKHIEVDTGEMGLVDGVDVKPGQKVGEVLRQQQEVMNAETPIPEMLIEDANTKRNVREIQIQVPKI